MTIDPQLADDPTPDPIALGLKGGVDPGAIELPEAHPDRLGVDVPARTAANFTAEGLTVYDNFPVLEAIWQAWTIPGYNPNWHELMRRNVRRDMPVLARALDRLEAERNG
jgi:hypothetical protein